MAPPLSCASEEVKFELVMTAFGPHTSIAPPLLLVALLDVKLELMIFILSAKSHTRIAPAFIARLSTNVEFMISPYFPTQSIAPPWPLGTVLDSK